MVSATRAPAHPLAGGAAAAGPTPDETGFRSRAAAFAEALLDRPPTEVATREVVAGLCAEGLAAARWQRDDDLYGVALVDELARRGLTSTAVVVSLHVESVVGVLRRFARPELQGTVAAALHGASVGCVAVSEPGGGSDLAAVATTATAAGAGWHISGEKKFVTLAGQADLAVVLARIRGTAADGRLGLFVVPRHGYEVVRTHPLVAGSHLETSWIRLDAPVPASNLLGRPGLGLAVLNWGLTKERLATAALVLGACRLALTLAVTHAVTRHQFGRRLIDHQAIRLRLADLDARLDVLASAVRTLAGGRPAPRQVAGLKVTAARFAERCLSECMHVFGGDGYVEDATPLGRLWRDVRLARIGGGTDEMMWELVAAGLTPDTSTYERHVPLARRHPAEGRP